MEKKEYGMVSFRPASRHSSPAAPASPRANRSAPIIDGLWTCCAQSNAGCAGCLSGPHSFDYAQCANCALWTTYGVFSAKDIFVWGPNGIGLSLGLAQIVLKVLFPSKPKA